ncbi:flagellar motor protein MotB [Pelagimonas sp. KU-00592-HH]|uniref:flagellar motor protein MotB n=1 Tax=Pelagimonas sp. KU-00592-HH TaxID=3127651 RepID=UPI0031090D6B
MAANAKVNIIRKIEVTEGHGHHGGAWKVAYADFMTAMMAFFLLLWILSSSDEQKLRGIAEYFTNATLPGGSGVLDGATLGPPGTLTASNGAVVARGADLGKVDDPSPAQWEVRDVTPTADPQEKVKGSNIGVHEYPAAGASTTEYADITDPQEETSAAAMADAGDTTEAGGAAASEITAEEAEQAADAARLAALHEELVQAMQDNPDLRPLQENVIFEKTPEGLRIQIVDQEGNPMFASGQAKMAGATEKLLHKLGTSLSGLPNKMVITGHTDSVPFTSRKAYDNWDLSTDRANATRRFLETAGVQRSRIIRVSGMADTDPLVEDDPKHASNRRISILLQFEKPLAPKQSQEQASDSQQAAATIKTADKPAAVESKAEAKPEPVTTAQMLDEAVFENLRSALR